MEQKAWKKYKCPECGVEHYTSLQIKLSPMGCGDCGSENAVSEDNFVQVEVYNGNVERNKKPVKTYETVQKYEEK